MSSHEVAFEELPTADLAVDGIYRGGRAGNAKDEPLPRLLGVSNQGGFRTLGRVENLKLLVLTSKFNDHDWPDHLDKETGVLTYFGDNKSAGTQLHETLRFGNRILRHIFDQTHGHPPARDQVPPILVFGGIGEWRDIRFLGLAVPGVRTLQAADDLVAVWRLSNGQRFQNYRAKFTILREPVVKRAWIGDVTARNFLTANTPETWRLWRETGTYVPLIAEKSVKWRNKLQQLPETAAQRLIVDSVYKFFQEDPVMFEHCAAKLAEFSLRQVFDVDVTRPTRDGGRDAIGRYRIGDEASGILIDFALEAKCYAMDSAVGVKEVSRLISRLRHRQFGVLVTTSYLHSQAYQEIIEDQHPIIVMSARDIANTLWQNGIATQPEVDGWLKVNFSFRRPQQ